MNLIKSWQLKRENYSRLNPEMPLYPVWSQTQGVLLFWGKELDPANVYSTFSHARHRRWWLGGPSRQEAVPALETLQPRVEGRRVLKPRPVTCPRLASAGLTTSSGPFYRLPRSRAAALPLLNFELLLPFIAIPGKGLPKCFKLVKINKCLSTFHSQTAGFFPKRVMEFIRPHLTTSALRLRCPRTVQTQPSLWGPAGFSYTTA